VRISRHKPPALTLQKFLLRRFGEEQKKTVFGVLPNEHIVKFAPHAKLFLAEPCPAVDVVEEVFSWSRTLVILPDLKQCLFVGLHKLVLAKVF